MDSVIIHASTVQSKQLAIQAHLSHGLGASASSGIWCNSLLWPRIKTQPCIEEDISPHHTQIPLKQVFEFHRKCALKDFCFLLESACVSSEITFHIYISGLSWNWRGIHYTMDFFHYSCNKLWTCCSPTLQKMWITAQLLFNDLSCE